MANPSRDKGTSWETRLVRWIRSRGFPDADRSPLRGSLDQGDIVGAGPFVIEAKDCRRLDLRKWCDEVDAEMKNSGKPFGVVMLKRSGTTDPGDGYAVVRIRDFVPMMEIIANLHDPKRRS